MVENEKRRLLLTSLLKGLYPGEDADALTRQILMLIEKYRPLLPEIAETRLAGRLSERDVVLITYVDQVQDEVSAPLQSLAEFCENLLAGVVSAIHLLPFFPYSSDDGFSVIDYRRIDPALGDWQMLARLRLNFALMFDAVINHVSVKSEWFQAFLHGDPRYTHYFITINGDPDLSQVVRPRTLPLLTVFETADGQKKVWTTFSADQVDLDYSRPAVLLEMIDILLFYVANGAEIIRLDAMAYLWKEIGTNCIHLPQTHATVRLLRAVLDLVAPYAFLITETNVPHRENITYFGDGYNEAQLVYNFALPPLALHTFYQGDATVLSAWAAGLETPSDAAMFFNFLASHDGIGLNPVREILSPEEIDRIITRVQKHGGLVSYKQNPDGSMPAYEMNISYFDALSDPIGGEPLEIQIERFLAAHAILLALPGVPGIYFHSLFGSRSWIEGVAETGRNRTINREKLDRVRLEHELSVPGSLRAQVFAGFRRLVQARSQCRAFHPNGAHRVANAGSAIFALWRHSPDSHERILCLHNVTPHSQTVWLNRFDRSPRDIISGKTIEMTSNGQIEMKPYQVLWLME